MEFLKTLKKHPFVFELLSFLNFKLRTSRTQKKQEAYVHSMTYKQYEEMDAEIYESTMGEKLDFSNLQSFTEKMQWAKIYDQDYRKTLCADKYLVRNYVKERIGEDYLIPLLWVGDKYSEIDFNNLPNQFVLKTNCGSGELTIVKNYSNLSFAGKLKMKKKIEAALNIDYSVNSCERHYFKIPKKILAEKFVVDSNGELNDYKFMCFDGKPCFVWVDVDRQSVHKRNLYDLNWNLLPFSLTFPVIEKIIEKPKNFDKMINIATKLSEGFSHVRVDLYNVDGRIYFGEMTFTSNSGFERFNPLEYDRKVGELWKLDMTTDIKPLDKVYK